MNYSVGIFIIPEELDFSEDTWEDAYSSIYGSTDIQDLIHSIVQMEEYQGTLLESDNFIEGSGYYFEAVFDITLTGVPSYKFITDSYYEEVKCRLVEKQLDEHEAYRIKQFTDTIEEYLESGRFIFFWCD